MSWKSFFNGAIRFVFLFAFGAFLWASIRHVAAFYHNFEPASTDWTSSYALAIAVDGTALILTIGVMFFGREMPRTSKITVWFFIIGLTGFSWFVNWEYALRFQSRDLTDNPILEVMNPILASSFAFLNLAYAIISETFTLRVKTVEELQQELDELQERSDLEKHIREMKKSDHPGLIERTKQTALDVKSAAQEVLGTQVKSVQSPPIEDEKVPELGTLQGAEGEQTTEQQAEVLDVPENEDDGRDTGTLAAVDANLIDLLSRYPKIAPLLSTSRRTATIREVAETTGYTEKWVRNRVANRLIKVSSRNKNLVLIDSLIAWLNSLPGDSQKEEDKPSLALVKDA